MCASRRDSSWPVTGPWWPRSHAIHRTASTGTRAIPSPRTWSPLPSTPTSSYRTGTTRAAGDSMEVRNYIVPAYLDQATAAFAVTPAIIGGYASTFGEYPFLDEKYGHAQFGWVGAMEHQTCTSISTGNYDESVIAHELAHQWFGDMVTCADFHHIWLNEGFATWVRRSGWSCPRGWRLPRVHERRQYLGAGHRLRRGSDLFGVIFDYNLSYLKAGWVVHMLRDVVGDADFFDGMRSYRERYADSTATTEHFQASWRRSRGAISRRSSSSGSTASTTRAIASPGRTTRVLP